MNKATKYILVSFSLAGMILALPAGAQFFDRKAASKAPLPTNRSEDAESPYNNLSAVETASPDTAVIPAERKTAVAREAYGKDPQEEPQKYYSTIGQVTIETTNEDADDELIMMYMKNFNVYRSPSGQTRCSVRFAVLTTLPSKLSNLSYRLKWPNMETTLSFNDVEPSVEYHYDYALLGEGCYNMDKQPNIIVNRCRARGLTQKACAAKIRWITAVNR